MVGDGPHYVGGSGGGGGGHVAVSLYGRSWAALLRVYWRRLRKPGINRGPPAQTLVRDTGMEPVTSSVSGKRSPAELIAPVSEFGGGDGNRTRVHGFAGRCLTTRPLHRRD